METSMPRLIPRVCFLLLLCSMAGHTQQPAPDAPDYSKEPFVIERLHTTQHFENDGTGTRRAVARIKVQNEAGVQALGQLVLGYNSANEKMTIDAVRVLKADGNVVTATASAVQDLSAPIEREAPIYTDYRQKHITVPGLRPGETLEYEITTTITTPLASGHFWLEYNFTRQAIVLDEQLEVSFPAGRAVKIKTLPREEGDPPLTFEEATADGRQIRRWKSANPTRPDDDEDDDTPAPRRKKKKSKLQSSEVQLTTFQSWAEVGRWYAQLERERVAPSDAVLAKARELTAGLSSDPEKVEGLYNYVARNFRYVSLSFGVGRYQPHSAADVLSNQYGDCKDKHTLLASLLRAAGLRAWPVLINSQRKIDEEMPSPSQFDHVISVVPLGEQLWWMDTTTEVAPFRLLSANLRKKQALAIPADGSEARLIETPPDPPFASTQQVEIEGAISELGKLDAKVTYLLRGDNELPLRMAFRRTPQGRWKEVGQMVAYSDGLGGQVSDVTPSEPASTAEPFRLEYRVSIPNFLDWSSKESLLRVPMPALGMPAGDPEMEEDEDPIELGSPTDIVVKLKLTLPAQYAARAPVSMGLKRDYAEYRSNYKVEGQTILAERTLRFLQREVAAARARDYVNFSRSVDSDEAQTIRITSAVAGTPAIPEAAKAEELFQASGAALRSGNFKLAVEMLERVTKLEPKHRRAWFALGSAHAALRQYDAAVDAFRKQAELNPYDEFAFTGMGDVFLQQQKYPEAADAFRKQLEVKPLDATAQSLLGFALHRMGKYEEAVNELEKAAVLDSKSAALRVNLGRAYLKLDRADEALQAFDKAIELQPSTTTFNNVAYELSLAGTHLDRAQQYAESAVAATAAQLRNASLSRLTVEDLLRVSGLAAYWDTLGWVFFQKGDLAKAEKFVEASWLLDFHGEVGDHLAQIYEKRGQKDKAARQYALALRATRPEPDTRQRLVALVGADKVPDLEMKVGEQLSMLRTIKLGSLVKETVSAELFVLLAPGPSGAVVEDVNFIRGDEKLRPFTDTVRAAKFGAVFPDDSPTKLVRRGILSCGKDSGCTFVLLTPDSVTSVN